MSTHLETVIEGYLQAKHLSRATHSAYASTLKKWKKWGTAFRSRGCGVGTFVLFWSGCLKMPSKTRERIQAELQTKRESTFGP